MIDDYKSCIVIRHNSDHTPTTELKIYRDDSHFKMYDSYLDRVYVCDSLLQLENYACDRNWTTVDAGIDFAVFERNGRSVYDENLIDWSARSFRFTFRRILYNYCHELLD